MSKTFRITTCRYYKTLAIAAIITGSSFQLATPLLAQPAPTPNSTARTQISNTATATYQDPNNPTQTLTTTSNTVQVTVAEIAGITVVGAGVTDVNGGSISTNDIVNFDYLITNVGNDTTRFFLPGAPGVITGGTAGTVQVIAVNGVALPTPINIPATGLDPNNATDYNAFITAVAAVIPGFNGNFAPGGTIEVRLPVTITGVSAGDVTNVVYGNTGANDNSPGTQNQPSPTAPAGNDLRTSDVPGESTPDTAPANGEREASASQTATLGTAVLQRALATVLKTRAGIVPGAANVLTDDQITYRLDLRVESTSSNPSFAPGSLEGSLPQAQVTGATAQPPENKFILVSDVIPQGTRFVVGGVVAPTGWTAVYSSTPGTPNNALTATWTTTAPTTQTEADGIRRIGFIYTGGNGTLAAGSSTATDANGFRFTVVTSQITAEAPSGQIANIAQVFGETVNDPANGTVYDESGDSKPNNFNDDNSPIDPNGLGGFDPNVDSGVADPANQGTDGNNNNTGTGPDGEANVISIVAGGNLLNGPNAQPGATGPGGSNQIDFTNRSVANPPTTNDPNINGLNPDTFNPDPLLFNNTANNPSPTATLDNVVIKPIAPSQADFVADNTAANQTDRNTGFGTDATLPNLTRVTIDDDGTGPRSATYEWNGTTFTLIAGTPIRFSGFGGGANRDYTVTVDLPGDQPQTEAFPIPIVTFVDQDGDNEFNRNVDNPTTTTVNEATLEPLFNVTIDRAYTGYMRLTKDVQILAADGTTILENFTPTPTVSPQSDQILVYRITYTNISTPSSPGISGSVLLNASNLTINEDGTTGGNNWALVPGGSSEPFTIHRVGTVASPATPVQFFNGATSLGNSDPTTGTSVTRYVNTVGTVAPGGTGSFTFQRQVN